MLEISVKKKINFIVLIGSTLHKYGASSDRIEKALTLTSQKLNLQGDFFATPTTLFACFKINEENSETRLVRLDVGKVNLTKLLLVDETVDEVLDEDLRVRDATKKTYDILGQGPQFGPLWVNFGIGITSLNIAILLGGSWADALLSFILGYLVGVFTETIRLNQLGSMSEGILAFVAGFSALYFSDFTQGLVSPEVVTVASLIILIPGLMLTTSIAELASDNLTSGTARLLGAIMILLKLAFGVYLGHLLAQSFNIQHYPSVTVQYPLLYTLPQVFLIAAAFVIVFQSRFKEYFWIFFCCLLAYLSSYYFFKESDDAIKAFLSGALIAAFSNLFSRITHKPALITLLPGITLLVPGSVGYRGIEAMINHQTLEGIDTIIRTFLVAIALVSGTFFGSILVKPKRSLDV